MLIFSELQNGSGYDLISREMLIMFMGGKSITHELLEMFKVVCSCTQLELASLKLTHIYSLIKAMEDIWEEDRVMSLQFKDVMLNDKEVRCLCSGRCGVNDEVVFFILMKCSTLMASSTPNSAKCHIIKAIIHSFEEVRIILVTTLHGFLIDLLHIKGYRLLRRF